MILQVIAIFVMGADAMLPNSKGAAGGGGASAQSSSERGVGAALQGSAGRPASLALQDAINLNPHLLQVDTAFAQDALSQGGGGGAAMAGADGAAAARAPPCVCLSPAEKPAGFMPARSREIISRPTYAIIGAMRREMQWAALPSLQILKTHLSNTYLHWAEGGKTFFLLAPGELWRTAYSVRNMMQIASVSFFSCAKPDRAHPIYT